MMVTQALLVLNVGVFAIMALNGVAMNPTGQQLVERGANFGPLTLGGQPWRLVTAMFLHGGFLHIFINMWCLWDLGSLCESLYGHATFGAVYLISGIAASLASVWWHPAVPSVGASGAVFGIIGALIASYYLGEFTMPRFVITRQLRTILIFAGYTLIFGGMRGPTDNAAHLGGLGTGLLFGALIARLAPGRDVFPRVAVILAVGLAVFACGAWLDHSRSYLIHSARGGQLLVDNETDRALVELQTAIRQRPDYVPAHYALADAFFRKKQYGDAERELKRVIELQPGHEPAHYELGIVYLNDNRIGEAKGAFNELLALYQHDPYAHFGLGRALAAEPNDARAVEEYKRALELGLQDTDLYYHLGISQARLKDQDQAIASFLKSLELRSGDDYDTETALADAYRAKGMQPEADAAMQKAEKLKPGK